MQHEQSATWGSKIKGVTWKECNTKKEYEISATWSNTRKGATWEQCNAQKGEPWTGYNAKKLQLEKPTIWKNATCIKSKTK